MLTVYDQQVYFYLPEGVFTFSPPPLLQTRPLDRVGNSLDSINGGTCDSLLPGFTPHKRIPG